MGRFLTTRRSEWLPGLAFGLAVAALLTYRFGPRPWILYMGLIGLAATALGRLERRRRQERTEVSPPRPRARPKVVQGGKYNLAEDDRTDSQKYVM